MSDNISRQAVLNLLKHDVWNDVIETIEAMPSTDHKGEWIYCEDDYGNDGYRCDKCGYHVPWDYSHKSIYFIEEYNFCPKCGSEMACDDYEYERAVEQLEHDIMFEPTYDVEDGSM